MRSYTVATVAITLRINRKWLDNTLSHHRIEGVVQSRQGVSRRLTPGAVLTLYIALVFIHILAVPLKNALDLANHFPQGNGFSRLALSPELTVEIDLEEMTREVASRLAAAVEVAPVPRRGRPRAG